MKKKPTEAEIEAYYSKLIAKFKKDPNWELQQEFGRLLMININDFTPEQHKRYNELKILLMQ
jgi:hypothetical protein